MVVPSILTLSTAKEATPLTAPLLIVAVPSVSDPPVTAPLAVIVLKAPVEAEFAPIGVPSIVPPSISAVVATKDLSDTSAGVS